MNLPQEILSQYLSGEVAGSNIEFTDYSYLSQVEMRGLEVIDLGTFFEK